RGGGRSLPTRRSSDLDQMRQSRREVQSLGSVLRIGDALGALDDVRRVLPGGQVEGEQHVRIVGVGRAQGPGDGRADEVLAYDERSEEHTSELQSRFDF